MHSIFDAHFHIIDPKFPLIKNQGFLPKPFLSEQYLRMVKDLNIRGGAIVSASYQGFDQTYLIEALNQLGPNFVGVTQLAPNVSNEEILRLSKNGVKAVRFNLYNKLSFPLSELEELAKRVYELANWHVELHIASSKIEEMMPFIKRLPAVTIDHMGLEKAGYYSLIQLVRSGVKVKASGFGRLESDFNLQDALKEIYSINPHALMFGTDMPSTRAKRPFHKEDVHLIYETFGEDATKKILFSNAKVWYNKT